MKQSSPQVPAGMRNANAFWMKFDTSILRNKMKYCLTIYKTIDSKKDLFIILYLSNT